MSIVYQPQLLYTGDGFRTGATLFVDDNGKFEAGATVQPDQLVPLAGHALMPGLVNVHSHSFQRLIRGKSESRATSGRDFWSWRGTMYHAAAHLSPQDVYDVARMMFLEMALSGITTVGEFHYLHNAPDGRPYGDPNLLGHQVIAAARSVGLRIVLLRAAYLRSGYDLPPDPGQKRFYESAKDCIAGTEALLARYADAEDVQIGIAPHSIRAVPLADLRELIAWAEGRQLPIHMHISEQVAENTACQAEYGCTPVTLLAREKLLTSNLTAVHAIHITNEEIRMLADAGATICSCPTTERNLGDGIFPAEKAMRAGIPIALGTDSQAQVNLLEDARQLDYHMRLQHQERAVLDQIHDQPLASRLFACATTNGARSLHVAAGRLAGKTHADFFTVDLDHPAIAGNSPEALLPLLVFGLEPAAIRDVSVHGRLIVRGGRHEHQEEIIARYKEVYRRVWADTPTTVPS